MTIFRGIPFELEQQLLLATAAARGMADSTIQTLGRWKSESFKRYIRMNWLQFQHNYLTDAI